MFNLFAVTGIRRPPLLGALVGLLLATAGTAQENYQIHIGDTLSLRFVHWDSIEEKFRNFNSLDGTYTVQPNGTVLLPVLGPVAVEALTPFQVADALAPLLQTQLGLVEPPRTSVSLAAHRPVYVLGAVSTPGAYDFVPGLTVQQALALAGGIETVLNSGPDGETAAIRAAGTLQEITIDLARQHIRAARLRAEMDGAETFTAPEGLTHPAGSEAVEAILFHERTLFQSRQEATDRALASLEASRGLLETERAALEEKLSGQARQLGPLREAVGNMEALFERGLVRSPSLVALQGQLINLENRQLDTETAAFRVRQSIEELEREKGEIEAVRRLDVLRELQTAETRIEQLSARQGMNRRLLIGAEALMAEAQADPNIRIEYWITQNGVESTPRAATLETRLSPADVLNIQAIVIPEI